MVGVESDEERRERLARRRSPKTERWHARLPALYAPAQLDGLFSEQRPEELRAWLGSESLTLFLAGPTGVGKTWAAYAVCSEVAKDRLLWVEAWNVVTLLSALLPGPESEETWAAVLECDLLLLDDLSMPRTTEWAVQTLYRITDRRVSEGKRQIVTGNAGYDELVEKWGGPTMDRLAMGAMAIVLTGKSLRKPLW